MGFIGFGCAPKLELPRVEEVGTIEVAPAPVAGFTSRSIRVAASDGEPRLFRGTVSDRQAQALSRGETSEAVLEREIPLLTLGSSLDGDTGARNASISPQWWLPEHLLDAAEQYTVVADGQRLEFGTLAEEPALVRVWPRENAASQAVFCLSTPVSFEPLGDAFATADPSVLMFGETSDAGVGSAEWTLLAHFPPCWSWHPRIEDRSQDGETVSGEIEGDAAGLRLAEMAGVAVQSTWYAPDAAELPTPPACSAVEIDVGFGCATVEDDRLYVRGGDTSSFWTVDGDVSAWFVLEPGRTGVVRGLKPDSGHELSFTVHFAGAPAVTHQTRVITGSTRPHVIINEVMADPAGSEPDQEWVELYNDGSNAVDLDGWTLKDENGEITLPSAWLAPSGYALLVNDTYLSNAAGEPVPEPNVLLVRLPVLAKSGLSNGGEALRLLDKSDMVVASFPGTPEPAPGVSVARGAPWQADEPSAFGRHSAPGASPGAPNRLRAVASDVR